MLAFDGSSLRCQLVAGGSDRNSGDGTIDLIILHKLDKYLCKIDKSPLNLDKLANFLSQLDKSDRNYANSY